MKRVLAVVSCSLAMSLCFGAAKPISYYMNHADAKLPSTSIGRVFNLVKFTDPTIDSSDAYAKSRSTNSDGSSVIKLAVSNNTSEKMDVYIQSSATLNSSAYPACTLSPNESSVQYNVCVTNMPSINSDDYYIFMTPATGSSSSQPFSSNNAYSGKGFCRSLNAPGGGATLSSNAGVYAIAVTDAGSSNHTFSMSGSGSTGSCTFN